MSLALIHSERFEDHLNPPGHPESAERAAVMGEVARRWRDSGGRILEPRVASRRELERVHTPAYLDRIAATSGRAVRLDPDTYTSPDSHEVALLAAGAAVLAVDTVLGDSGPRRMLALVRPPGHHAEAARAMGFCLYNSVAVAAAQALAAGVPRVAVVDYDVHHGNGTQWMFYEDPRVLYVSTHQYPYYPGTGAATDVGRGAGEGFTVNVPLEAGATDADYDLVFRELIVPVLDRYAPGLILVSAGFDAHERDPLAGMRMTTPGYATLTARLRAAADRSANGRIVLITEGGYDLQSLAGSLEAALGVLEPDAPSPVADGIVHDGPAARGRAALDAARAALTRFWQL